MSLSLAGLLQTKPAEDFHQSHVFGWMISRTDILIFHRHLPLLLKELISQVSRMLSKAFHEDKPTCPTLALVKIYPSPLRCGDARELACGMILIRGKTILLCNCCENQTITFEMKLQYCQLKVTQIPRGMQVPFKSWKGSCFIFYFDMFLTKISCVLPSSCEVWLEPQS